jgi:hypothetical protein
MRSLDFLIAIVLPAEYGTRVIQPLTEMNTWNISGGKGLTTSLLPVSQLFGKSGNRNISQPYGAPWPVTGIAL